MDRSNGEMCIGCSVERWEEIGLPMYFDATVDILSSCAINIRFRKEEGA